jgi:hypothetical protein
MAKFWDALAAHRLLDPTVTETLLRSHVDAPSESRPTRYGYGVWIAQDSRRRTIHYVEGWDPGVAFLSAADLDDGTVVTIAHNTNRSVWKVFERIEPLLYGV